MLVSVAAWVVLAAGICNLVCAVLWSGPSTLVNCISCGYTTLYSGAVSRVITVP